MPQDNKENLIKNSEFNRADVKSAERMVCDKCCEHIIFLLEDSKQHKFSLGLKTVLECVAFAIENGDLPKLPTSWLDDVDRVYGTAFLDNKDISYYDYETYQNRYK